MRSLPRRIGKKFGRNVLVESFKVKNEIVNLILKRKTKQPTAINKAPCASSADGCL